MNRYDIAVLQGRSQSSFAISATAAQSPVLSGGVFDVWADVDCWLKVGPDATTGLTSATGYALFANNVVSIDVRDGDRIGAIAGGAGTLRFHQVG